MGILSAIYYRLKVHAPKALAIATGELPLRPLVVSNVDSSPSSYSTIPRFVYQTWKDKKFGKTHAEQLRRFMLLNDDYAFVLYDEAEMNAYMERFYAGEPILNIFNSSHFGPLRTDIWRYCILYERGGVYCDIGKGFNDAFSKIIPQDALGFIGFERNFYENKVDDSTASSVRHRDKRVINWAMAFAPRHPFLKRVIDGIIEKHAAYAGKSFPDPKLAILNFSGPIHLTECLHAQIAIDGLAGIHQSDVDFGGAAIIEMPGSYVRYVNQISYVTARNCEIVD